MANTNLGASICTSVTPSLLISSGHSPRLGGTIFVWGAEAVIWGARTRNAPPWRWAWNSWSWIPTKLRNRYRNSLETEMMQLIKPNFNQYTVNTGFCKIKTMLQIYCLLNPCFQLDYRLCFICCSRQRALHYSVVMKRELSKKAKLSIFKAVFVPILIYCMVVNRGFTTIVKSWIVVL